MRLLAISRFYRGECEAIGYGLTQEEYVDKMWEARNAAYSIKESNPEGWPINRTPAPIASAPIIRLRGIG